MSDDPDTHAGEDRPSLRREWRGDAGEDAHTGPLFSPDEVEATRLREQGIGVGAEELRLQRDPTGATASAEFRGRTNAPSQDVGPSAAADRPDAGR